jgi:hypothetical protein
MDGPWWELWCGYDTRLEAVSKILMAMICLIAGIGLVVASQWP